MASINGFGNRLIFVIGLLILSLSLTTCGTTQGSKTREERWAEAAANCKRTGGILVVEKWGPHTIVNVRCER